MALPRPDPSSVALVTGASSGIGEEFARQLSARGHRVALVARRADRLERLASELGGGDRAIPIPTDLAVSADRDRPAAQLDLLGARVEVLVNSAGFGLYQAFVDNDRERELQLVRLDVEAVVDLMARYLPGMVARGRGAVINLSSSSGFLASPYNAGYAAAKAHTLMLSEAVHEEVARSGVTVTAVCPGPVPTEFGTVNDAAFARRLPKILHVSAERVVADSLTAVEQGKRTVVPGSPLVKAFFGSGRLAPSPIALQITKRLMAR